MVVTWKVTMNAYKFPEDSYYFDTHIISVFFLASTILHFHLILESNIQIPYLHRRQIQDMMLQIYPDCCFMKGSGHKDRSQPCTFQALVEEHQ
jgi:hypothetical protein